MVYVQYKDAVKESVDCSSGLCECGLDRVVLRSVLRLFSCT